jgi:serine/threonine protein kinase
VSLEAGTQLGPYRIVSLLGAGGMGEVYRARDTRLERDVALKVIPADKTADVERKKRFLHEARAASSLNHPSIVAIYDIGIDAGMDYIAMELVQGATLDEKIPRKGMRLGQALRTAIAIADALGAAHAAGIVHRDLKPGNVIIGEDGRVKLLDFGLAKLMAPPLADLDNSGTLSDMSGPRTAKGAIVGTVSYMAPEQAEGKKVDARSDIFSFGAILYEMLTGERAFHSDTTLSTLSAILKEDPKRIGSLVTGVPPELERIIARCLKKDPERRWQGMRDIKVALEELKEESDSGVLSAAATAGSAQKVGRGGKRSLGLALGAMGLLVVGGVAFWLTRERPAAVDRVEESPAAAVPVEESRVNPPADSAPPAVSGPSSTPPVSAPSVESAPRKDRAPRTTPAPRTVSVPPTAVTPPPRPGTAAARSAPKTVLLGDGTSVSLVLLEDLSSATAESGNRIALKVSREVKIGGVVVIAKGADASATVAEAEKKRVFRRTPKLTLRMSFVKASDGESIRLRAVEAATARGTPADVVDTATLVDASAAAKGKDLVVPKGTEVTAFVDEEKVFPAPAGD